MYGPPYAKLYYSILSDARIKPSEKMILLALQKWGWKDHECWPAVSTIATQTALGERTVQVSLKNLKKLGLIKEVSDDANPTGRKLVLLFLSDPTYLPPLREKKPNLNPKTKTERTCALTEAEIIESAQNYVQALIQDGQDENSVYDSLGKQHLDQNLSDEQFAWYEKAYLEAMQGHSP
jgi:DNA-binding transcriptional ArsR family regulator